MNYGDLMRETSPNLLKYNTLEMVLKNIKTTYFCGVWFINY